ncbi:MAG: sodium:proton antiporter NhaD [Muribaculaceae bacterium]|nr:sodium:proton antiporter NhaD [Muribaculaceae bacterium]
MITTVIIIFVIGYLGIALEHPLKVDKTATALLLGMLLWILYALGAEYIVPMVDASGFNSWLAEHPQLAGESLHKQALSYVTEHKLVESLGDITQTLFFLIGAMTIVELVDIHGGFTVITAKITTRNKRTLMWVLIGVSFIFSAVLDNMTTTIVMVLLLRKIIEDQKDRWLYAGLIVIAANTGGAWSPIGDVTTIMLWVKGNVTSVALIERVLLPSIVAVVVPALIIQPALKGAIPPLTAELPDQTHGMSSRERLTILILGVAGLLFVPIFKSITHLPPFVGMLFVLGVLWVYTDCYYNGKRQQRRKQHRLPEVVSRIDMPSILFFLGILLAVSVLEASGVLAACASWLDSEVHNIYIIDILLGIMSSIFDNVPLVAGVMGMYPVEDPAAIGYAANFVQDGPFWEFLSYCAGVGGSLLIIGSAAGVIAMGLEKINFGWYLKKISWAALAGYLAGAAVYMLEIWLW